jgi:hypothetical protein
MKQETLGTVGNIQNPSSNQTQALWSWIAAIALTVALAMAFGSQFKAQSVSDQAAISDYFTALCADELSPFK